MEREIRIPILMYHSIGSIKRGEGLRSLHVPKWLLSIHFFILKILGYQGKSMEELMPYLNGEKFGKVVGITFDDGYENNYYNALPILKKYRFTATCYIVANNIGGKNYWDIPKNYKVFKMMNTDQIKSWISSGMDIGSHSLNHIRLDKIDQNTLDKEISKSKEKLEKIFGVRINHFCYPYGAKNTNVTDMVESNNYKTGVTVKRGIMSKDSDLFSLPRVTITHKTFPHLFLLKLFTNYEKPRKD